MEKGFKYILCSYLSTSPTQIASSIVSFKYILCSYLSQLVSGRHLRFTGFKYILCSYLSHGTDTWIKPFLTFKYILCSYLSFESTVSALTGSKFKYILCSYLSERREGRTHMAAIIQIHLMFLFICFFLLFLPIFYNSNTSYVLIYLLPKIPLPRQ